ncbi:hypothetical protein J6590_024285 [Homalodisca vitripennis]|nr:hypothetical protein J6590_024285 [Homalodisca vitripennis]
MGPVLNYDVDKVINTLNRYIATRSRDLFARQQHRTNHAANNTMYRLQSSGNSVADIVDFFVDSIPVLKRRIAGLHELSA